MRDKGLGVAVALGMVVFVLIFALSQNGAFSNTVASSDVTVRTAAPTVDDDIDRGFLPGFIWVDQTGDTVYIAEDVSDGAANWLTIAP